MCASGFGDESWRGVRDGSSSKVNEAGGSATRASYSCRRRERIDAEPGEATDWNRRASWAWRATVIRPRICRAPSSNASYPMAPWSAEAEPAEAERDELVKPAWDAFAESGPGRRTATPRPASNATTQPTTRAMRRLPAR